MIVSYEMMVDDVKELERLNVGMGKKLQESTPYFNVYGSMKSMRHYA